jgi:hypothetical protein
MIDFSFADLQCMIGTRQIETLAGPVSRFRKCLRAALPALLLAGCAQAPMQTFPRQTLAQQRGPIGRDFPQSALDGFILDVTSLAEAEAALGVPAKTTKLQGLVPANAKMLPPGSAYSITSVIYVYFPNGIGEPALSHPGKAAALAFLNDRLIGYSADSNIPGQANNPVDERKLAGLRQCHTTRAEAIAMLGQPNGRFIHVLDAQAGAIELAYHWTEDEAGGTALRNLRIVFDRNGVLSNYTLVNQQDALPGLPAQPLAAVPPPTAVLPLPACPSHGAGEPT